MRPRLCGLETSARLPTWRVLQPRTSMSGERGGHHENATVPERRCLVDAAARKEGPGVQPGYSPSALGRYGIWQGLGCKGGTTESGPDGTPIALHRLWVVGPRSTRSWRCIPHYGTGAVAQAAHHRRPFAIVRRGAAPSGERYIPAPPCAGRRTHRRHHWLKSARSPHFRLALASPLTGLRLDIPDHAESDVSRSAIGRIRRARGVPISETKRFVAKVRSASHDPRRSRRRTDGIRARGVPMPLRIEIIGAPLPHVAGDSIHTVAVWSEAV